MSQPISWGTHVEFVRRYATFHVAVNYGLEGCEKLVDGIVREVRGREVRRLLDCAAGIGFPALDLALRSHDSGLDSIHASDGDRLMVRELMRQAADRHVDVEMINPRQRSGRTPRQIEDDLIVNWGDLRVARGTYDYVMCRGNSLVYADTWGGQSVVTPLPAIRDHLARMANKVEPGGYLHVDAPWELRPRSGPSVIIDTPTLKIEEEIKDHDDHREWLLSFTEVDDDGHRSELAFRRLSSRLTIHGVRRALRRIGGFDDPDPVQLDGERLVFGTIIAQKVG